MQLNVTCSVEVSDSEVSDSVKKIEEYVWTFKTTNKKFKDIFVDTLIELQLKNNAKTSLPVTIEIPSNKGIKSNQDKGRVNIEVGNPRVLEWGSLNIEEKHGLGYWEDDEYEDNPTVLSFKLTGNYPGKTMLILTINAVENEIEKEYVFPIEVHVMDGRGETGTGDVNREDQLHPYVKEHVSRARIVAGKPFYDSAEFRYTRLGANGDDVGLEEGEELYFGISKKGKYSELFKFADDSVERVSSDKDYIYSDVEDFSYADIWWEIPDRKDADGYAENLQSVPLELGNKFRTTKEQMNDKNFVPYFVIKASGDLEWSFINYATKAKATPAITSLKINDVERAGTSGTVTNFGYPQQINFEYDFEGVTYRWEFRDMASYPRNYILDYGSLIPIVETKSVSSHLILINPSEVNSVQFLIDDKNIASASSEKLTSLSNKTPFTLNGNKAGDTKLNVVVELKDSTLSPYNKYRRFYRYDNYNGVDEKLGYDIKVFPFANKSSTVWVTIHAATLNGYASGEEPYYFTTANDDKKQFWLEFDRDVFTVKLPRNAEGNKGVYCKAILDSHILDGKLNSFTIQPALELYDDFTPVDKGANAEVTLHVNYKPEEHLFVQGDKIDWDIPGVAKTNSGNVVPTEQDVLTVSEQKKSIRPLIKIYKKGLNVESVEWFFVDSNGNPITSKTQTQAKRREILSDENIKIWNVWFIINDGEIAIRDSAGEVELNWPGINLSKVEITYDRYRRKINDDIVDLIARYTSRFRYEGSNLFTWDTASNDVPLVMYPGDTKTLTLTANSVANPVAFIGDSSIAGLEEISRDANSVKVKLTANKAGMTTLTLGSSTSNALTRSREVWVANTYSATGRLGVPYLTDYLGIEDFVEILTDDEFIYNGQDPEIPDIPDPVSPDVPDPVSPDIPDPVSPDVPDPVSPDQKATIDTNLHSGGGTNKIQIAVTPKFAEFARPISDFTTSANQKALVSEFQDLDSSITDDIEISVISGDSVTISDNTRGVQDISASDLNGQQLAVILREIEVKKTKLYTFNVDFSNLQEGMYMYWKPLKKTDVAASIDASDSSQGYAMYFDSEGNRIDQVPSNKKVDVVAYLEAGSYAPIFTTDAVGKEQGEDSTSSTNSMSSSGSSSSCNSYIPMSALALLGLFFIKRRK